MAKRSAEHLEELAGPQNKKSDCKQSQPTAVSKQLDFSGLQPETLRLMTEAVDAALVADSAQPIVLDLVEGSRCDGVAYWPKSRELGLWLLQALAVLKQQDVNVHCEFVAALSSCLDDRDCELVFRGHCDNAIKCPADLGRFRGVLELDEAAMEPDDEHFVARASLATHLYHQQCYVGLASFSSDGEEEEDDESSGDEAVKK